jgi:hypothetical protein
VKSRSRADKRHAPRRGGCWHDEVICPPKMFWTARVLLVVMKSLWNLSPRLLTWLHFHCGLCPSSSFPNFLVFLFIHISLNYKTNATLNQF